MTDKKWPVTVEDAKDLRLEERKPDKKPEMEMPPDMRSAERITGVRVASVPGQVILVIDRQKPDGTIQQRAMDVMFDPENAEDLARALRLHAGKARGKLQSATQKHDIVVPGPKNGTS